MTFRSFILEKMNTLLDETIHVCCNLSLGLTTKARACKGVGQEGSSGVKSHDFESAKECEGMNPHTPK
jgi:hypothetical protein